MTVSGQLSQFGPWTPSARKSGMLNRILAQLLFGLRGLTKMYLKEQRRLIFYVTWSGKAFLGDDCEE